MRFVPTRLLCAASACVPGLPLWPPPMHALPKHLRQPCWGQHGRNISCLKKNCCWLRGRGWGLCFSVFCCGEGGKVCVSPPPPPRSVSPTGFWTPTVFFVLICGVGVHTHLLLTTTARPCIVPCSPKPSVCVFRCFVVSLWVNPPLALPLQNKTKHWKLYVVLTLCQGMGGWGGGGGGKGTPMNFGGWDGTIETESTNVRVVAKESPLYTLTCIYRSL